MAQPRTVLVVKALVDLYSCKTRNPERMIELIFTDLSPVHDRDDIENTVYSVMCD